MVRTTKAKSGKSSYAKPRMSNDLNGPDLDKVAGGGCGSGFETCTDGAGAVGACNAGPQIKEMPICHAGLNDRYGCRAGSNAGKSCDAGNRPAGACSVGV